MVAVASDLFGPEEGEDDGAAWARAVGEDVSQREDGGGSGSIVVGAVVEVVAMDGGADAEVVEVRGEEYDLVGGRAAAQDGDGVPCLFAGGVFELRELLLEARGEWGGEGGLLEEGVVVAAGLEAEGLELRGGEEGGDVLIAGC